MSIAWLRQDETSDEIFLEDNLVRQLLDGVVSLTSLSFPSLIVTITDRLDNAVLADFHRHDYLAYPLYNINLSAQCTTTTKRVPFLDSILKQLVFSFADAVCVNVHTDTDLYFLRHIVAAVARIWTQSHVGEACIVFVCSDAVKKTELTSQIDSWKITKDVFMINSDKNIGSVLRLVRQSRQKKCLLFNAKNFAYLWHLAATNVSTRCDTAICAIKSLRADIRPDPGFTKQLSVFLTQIKRFAVDWTVIKCFVASAILLRVYPPDRHHFCPRQVFASYYQEPCLRALYKDPDAELEGSLYCREIQDQLIQFADRLGLGFESALDIRRRTIRKSHAVWSRLRSTFSCFFCLHTDSEHVLPCGHGLCDSCLCELGTETVDVEYEFTLDACPLCLQRSRTTRNIKPPTAGIRLLSLDGGGIGAAIAIQILCQLAKCVSPIKIQDLFDQAVGTSSGGLVVTSLFLLGQSPQECGQSFESLSTKIFSTQPRKLEWLMRIFRLIVNDGIYDSNFMSQLLQEYFPPSLKMHNQPAQLPTAKVAVTVSDIHCAEPFLLTNYAGLDLEKTEGYRVLRSNDAPDVPLWKAARATSAAPTSFTAIDIEGYGTFQDGGLRANNPTKLAMSEGQRLWKSTRNDVILSIGTGKTKESSPIFSRGSVIDGFASRLFRYLKYSTDGTRIHREILGGLSVENKPNYMRYDIQLDTPFALDNIAMIPTLRDLVDRSAIIKDDFNNLVFRLLTSSFYLTTSVIKRTRHGVLYMGILHCRSRANAVLQALKGRFPNLTLTNGNIHVGKVDASLICNVCQRFYLTFSSWMGNEDMPIKLQLRCGSAWSYVSGCPQSLAWFCQQQTTFGANGEGNRGNQNCRLCRKRARSHDRSDNLQKRRKLY